MITGSEQESRELMMNAAIRIVVKYGFEGFTTKKWASEAGVAEGSLYYHFKSKADLLDQTFFMIEKEIAATAEKGEYPIGNKDELVVYMQNAWKEYFHYFIENSEKTIFYYRFKNSSFYTKEIQDAQTGFAKKFKNGIEFLQKTDFLTAQLDPMVLRSYVVDATVSIAYRASVGGIRYSDETEEQLIRLMMHGIAGFVKSTQIL